MGDTLGDGSLKNEQEFNLFRHNGINKTRGRFFEEIRNFGEDTLQETHTGCFAHGDPSRSNIMVQTDRKGNIKVVGLIDFGTEGVLLIRRDHKAMLEKT